MVKDQDTKHKVLMYDPMHSQGTRLLEHKCEIIYAASKGEKDLALQVKDVDAIICRGNGLVTKTIIESAPQLKVIGKHGVGINNIDLNAARSHGIIVVNTPTSNFRSVAEYFVCLANMLAKNVKVMQRTIESGNWPGKTEYIGSELNGKNLGSMGFGRTGRQTARICKNGFNMKVIYFNRTAKPEAELELNAKRVDPVMLFSISDFISINLPLCPETRHMVSADLIMHMKPGAFLINMARGAVWKEKDVLKALHENIIVGAGSDVFDQEPISAGHPLLKMENFVGTPHIAARTEESAIKTSTLVAEGVLYVLEGREPKFPVK